ncbi:MAG: diguanylate cyclase [Chloroflexota bacterium]
MRRLLSTGDELYTEDVFWVLFDYEVTRSQRYPAPLTLIHIETAPSVGDASLLRAATSVFNAALNSHLRSADISSGDGKIYRILLPTTNEEGGRAVCDRLISIFHNRFQSREGETIIFTINIGMASHPGGSTLLKEDLLAQAEKALRQAQLKGSNTYLAYSDL